MLQVKTAARFRFLVMHVTSYFGLNGPRDNFLLHPHHADRHGTAVDETDSPRAAQARTNGRWKSSQSQASFMQLSRRQPPLDLGGRVPASPSKVLQRQGSGPDFDLVRFSGWPDISGFSKSLALGLTRHSAQLQPHPHSP